GYKAYASPAGSNYDECREIVLKALKVNVPCPYKNCTFNGIWNGGGGSGQKNLVLTSSFYYQAIDVGFADYNKPSSIVHPKDYETAAKQACEIPFKDVKSTYPHLR
ncbi:hypothetical protein EI013_29125, partial [Escherichia coli]|nr:hypothetical protein [Escherichia coli]